MNSAEDYFWPFSYQPYDVQKQFMMALADCIRNRKTAIMESPTGTGKSLSIICSSLHWLKMSLDRSSVSSKKRKQEHRRSDLSSLVDVRKNDIQSEVANILNKIRSEKIHSSDNDFEGEAGNELPRPRVIVSSRTHTQLGQFFSEIKKAGYSEDLKIVSLASRKHLCVNPKVLDLGSDFKINEKCADLCERKKCGFNNPDLIERFAEFIISKPTDIEDLVRIGKKKQTCSYYSSKQAAKAADVVLLPYSFLLDDQVRDTLAFDFSETVVIFDEAHNILDSIRNLFSAKIFISDLTNSLKISEFYVTLFSERFSTTSRTTLLEFISFLKSVYEYLLTSSFGSEQVLDFVDFLLLCKQSHLDLYKLYSLISGTNLAPRMQSAFRKNMEKMTTPEKDPNDVFATSQSLVKLLKFMKALTAHPNDGKIIIRGLLNESEASIEYILLDASSQLSFLLMNARSVIFTGGTMKPFDELKDIFYKVFGFVSEDAFLQKVTLFSCAHVVPKQNVCSIISSTGPTGKKLYLNFENRKDAVILNEIGLSLTNICGLTPKGIVAFFPSYSFLNDCLKEWENSNILCRLRSKKKVFVENASANIFEAYSQEISRENSLGAVLFAVVAGKLSEGINFSHDLCRCVIVIGMPFANPKDVSIKIRQNSPNYLEYMCMKNVNQCAGRSIRSFNDYAAIILLDERYLNEKIISFLPTWVSENISKCETFGKVHKILHSFFKEQKASG